MVTFETKVYEKDWEYLLTANYVDRMISACNYDFNRKILFINNVRNKIRVASYADKKVQTGIIDCYYFVDDYAKEALDYFDIAKKSFEGGYCYSISELVSIYLCNTDYLLHFSSDSYLEENKISWIDNAIGIFQKRNDIIVANPIWNFKYDEAKSESFSEIDDFFLGYGFSDQCYLIRMDIFKNKIYNEKHIDSKRYPKHGGESFEKRIDSYMRNHKLLRITSKEVSYIHQNFPINFFSKYLYKRRSGNSFPIFGNPR